MIKVFQGHLPSSAQLLLRTFKACTDKQETRRKENLYNTACLRGLDIADHTHTLCSAVLIPQSVRRVAECGRGKHVYMYAHVRVCECVVVH